MIENRKGEGTPCSYCYEHPNAVSRIAMLEKGMTGVEEDMKTVRETLESMRAEIIDGIMHRYPSTVVWIISLLSSFCSALLAAVLGHLYGK